jgi:predicted DNA-binding protein
MAKVGRPKKDESVQLNFRLSKTMRDRLEDIAKESGLTVTGLIKILIEDFLTQRDISGLVRENKEQTLLSIYSAIAGRFLMLAGNANALLGRYNELDFEEMNRRAKAINDLNLDPVGLINHKLETDTPEK